MVIGYYPGWDAGFVRDGLDALRDDGQRKKAAAKLDFDLQMLAATWPRPQFVTIKMLKSHRPLYELTREYQGIAYRVFFCVQDQDIWLLHLIEKKKRKTPAADLNLAHARMRDVLTGKVRRTQDEQRRPFPA